MVGYFSHLFENHNDHKNGVPSVPGVPNVYNTSISDGFTGTQQQEHQKEAEKWCSSHGVPVKPSVYKDYIGIGTPEHGEHPKNNHSEYDIEYYHERAAIQEYDGGLSRAETEKSALLLWIHDHPSAINKNLCAGCGKPVTSEQDLIEYGAIRVHWDSGDKSKNIHCYKNYIERRMPEAWKALGINNFIHS